MPSPQTTVHYLQRIASRDPKLNRAPNIIHHGQTHNKKNLAQKNVQFRFTRRASGEREKGLSLLCLLVWFRSTGHMRLLAFPQSREIKLIPRVLSVIAIRKTLLNKKYEMDKKNIFPSLRSYYKREERAIEESVIY